MIKHLNSYNAPIQDLPVIFYDIYKRQKGKYYNQPTEFTEDLIENQRQAKEGETRKIITWH